VPDQSYTFKPHFFVCFVLLFETGSLYVAQAGLELEILLPQPPKRWDERYVPIHPDSNHILNALGWQHGSTTRP
jgi:hypothetical protein